jgi:hypothetical protein
MIPYVGARALRTHLVGNGYRIAVQQTKNPYERVKKKGQGRLVEGTAKSCEVMFEFPQVVGVDHTLLGLRCGFILECREALFIVKNPLGIFELKLKQFPFSPALPASPKQIAKYSLSIKTLFLKTSSGFLFTPLLVHRSVFFDIPRSGYDFPYEIIVPHQLYKPSKHVLLSCC